MVSHTKKELQVIKHAYESSLDGWYDWYLKTDELILSKRYLAMIGIESEDRIEDISIWAERVHPDDWEDTNSLLDEHLKGETEMFSCVYRFRHVKGHYVWIFDRGKVIERDAKGNALRMTGFHSDISVFRETSRQLAQSKKELEYRVAFEDIINKISSGFINISIERIDKQIEEALGLIGRFMKVDRSYIFIIDHQQQTMSNSHEWCADGIEPQKINLFDIPLEAMPWWFDRLKKNKSIVYPDVTRLPDEAALERETLILQSIKSIIVVPMLGGSNLVGFVGFDAVADSRVWSETDELMLKSIATTFLNVLVLKDAQTELQRYRNHLQEMVDLKTHELNEKAQLLIAKDRELNTLWYAIHNSANGIVITDAQKKIIYYNGAFCRFSGYNDQELIGKTPVMLQSGKHDAKMYTELRNTLLSGKTWKGQFINKRKDGTFYTEENVITPIHDEDGNIINYIAIKQDITREILLRTESERNEKLRALGTLAGGIAHDFNNILQIIQSYSELLEIGIKQGKFNEGYFHQILGATSKGKKLVDSILTFSKQEVKPLEERDISQLTIHTIETIKPLFLHRINFITQVEDCGAIPINPIQYQQVLINLVDNSADAVVDDKDVTIALQRKKVHCDIRHVDIEIVELSVSDKGHGMTEETIARLFEPFFTTKPVGEGTGLGMPMVRGIVENHKGRIFVESTPGKGTTIRLHFYSRLEDM